MTRNRKRKSNIGLTDENVMKTAVASVLDGGLSTKAAAERYDIPRTTLRRYIRKCRDADINWNEPAFPRMRPNYQCRKIFSDEEESELCEYLIICGKLHHGLPPKAARKLAYDLAVANHKIVPENWHRDQSAGKEWFTSFMKRNPVISLRAAEATSIARAAAFNKPVVYKLYDNLRELYEKYPSLNASKIYNTDETALTTVQGSSKIIAQKGQRQVGQVTSAERGVLVTMCGTINALGNCIPPFLIFPRVHFKDHMIKNAPIGTVGSASSSGWITCDIFEQWMHHFIKFAKPSLEDPVLLIMDNHEAHLSFKVIQLAKNSGVILLTLPPHTSHKLQPLDKCVYGPLKRYYNDACRSWLASNPGKRISIYEIAELLNNAYPLAFTQKNCIAAFKSTGIFPINKYVYGDDEYLAAEVTNKSELEQCTVSKEREIPRPVTPEGQEIMRPSTSKDFPEQSLLTTITSDSNFVSPEMVRPYPKVNTDQNINKKGGRKKKRAEILTSTPVMDKMEEEIMEKKRKESLKRKKMEEKVNKQRKKKPIMELLESSSESDSEIPNLSHTSDEDLSDNISEENIDTKIISVKTFVLVKFPTKRCIKYYVGQIENINTKFDEYSVNFLRKVGNKFLFPNVRDEATVTMDDIVIILPPPLNTGGTSRLQTTFRFSIDLSGYNII